MVSAAERRAGLEGRMAFAPVTEMTDDFVREVRKSSLVLQIVLRFMLSGLEF